MLIPLLRSERPEQHDPGVIHQNVCSAQLVPHTLRSGNKRVPVSYIRLHGDRARTKFTSERLDAVDPPCQKSNFVAVARQGARRSFANARRGTRDYSDAAPSVLILTHGIYLSIC
jgi:hypothetical protein